jgi:mitogen-activated protein kinase kinase 4
MLNELDIVMRENTCPHIVQFYGALFKEGDCWICMELMDTSLDRFYKFVYHKLHQSIPESVLAYITLSVSLFYSYFIIRIFCLDFTSP